MKGQPSNQIQLDVDVAGPELAGDFAQLQVCQMRQMSRFCFAICQRSSASFDIPIS